MGRRSSRQGSGRRGPRRRRTWRCLLPARVFPEPAIGGEHPKSRFLGAHRRQDLFPGPLTGRVAAVLQLAPGPCLCLRELADDVHVAISERPRIQTEPFQPVGGDDVDGGGEAVERLAERQLPATIGGTGAFPAPPGHPVMARPAGLVVDRDDRQVVDPHCVEQGTDGRSRDSVEAREQPVEEQVPELLVVAVQLAVRRDQQDAIRAVRRLRGPARLTRGQRHAMRDGRRGASVDDRVESRTQHLLDELIRVTRGAGIEAHRARDFRIVEDDPDRRAAERHAPRHATRDRPLRLPRREDRPADALLGADPERQPVHRGLRQPDPGGRPTEAQFEVPEAPPDLRASIPRRRQGQDRVVVGLRDRVVAVVLRHEVGMEPRLLAPQPRGEGRSHVPADARDVASIRIRPVGLLGDPGVPVGERRGARVRWQAPAERVLARRLVEVPVHRHPRTVHGRSPSSAAKSRAWWAVKRVPNDSELPAGRVAGQRRCRRLPW